MTLDLTVTEAARDAGTAVAAAVARALPLDLNPDAPLDENSLPSQMLAGPDSRAVSATVRGQASGSLVVVLSAEAALALTTGPLASADLAAAVQPALDSAAAALTQLCGGPVEIHAPFELAAEQALSPALGGQTFFATLLVGASGHVGTVALTIGPPDVAAIPAPRAATEAHAFPSLPPATAGVGGSRPLELLHDVEMGVTVELGRARMSVRNLLSLAPGAIVELDRAAGSPVDVLVNGTLIGRGEVVVIDEEFGIRITEIIGARPPAAQAR